MGEGSRVASAPVPPSHQPLPQSSLSPPLARRSVSLRVYPADLSPGDVVADLRAQARAAEEAGFDGVMTSEHHGGFPNYLPNPLLAATWLLEATSRIWAAPCPLVLPLRPVSQVAEDLAWTHHRFPGRVGVGVCAGALPVDFELAGVPFGELFPRYRAGVVELLAALAGRPDGPLAGEPGIAGLRAGDIPVVAAVQAERTVRRAASQGIGVLFDSLQTVERTRALTDAYREAGGTGPTVLIRRLWVGPAPTANMAVQMDRYRGYASPRAMAQWGDDDALIAGASGVEVADRLHDALARSGCDTVNVRVFLAGLTPSQVRDQIEHHGAETLPRLRTLMAG
jgi:alkanesulfonate monooxygenase SsuD/methylene tetrahydromethanopterin reductase-like flavin-dependent oxidoreductase (luciferase family)